MPAPERRALARGRGRRNGRPPELSDDPRFARRVKRLIVVASTMLAVIWVLAATTTDAPQPLVAVLAAGWVSQTAVLWYSLRRPRARYGLVVPSTLVCGGLLTLLLWWRPDDSLAAAGWVTTTTGILLGATLGAWLWFRWAPVPGPLRDPFAPGRWTLVGVHAGLVGAGLLLVIASNLG